MKYSDRKIEVAVQRGECLHARGKTLNLGVSFPDAENTISLTETKKNMFLHRV